MWDTGPDMTVREPRGLDFASQEEPKKGRKRYHQMHTRASRVAQMVKKNLPANAGDLGSISGSGRFPGEGNGYPLQCSCLENPMDSGAWRTTVCGVE